MDALGMGQMLRRPSWPSPDPEQGWCGTRERTVSTYYRYSSPQMAPSRRSATTDVGLRPNIVIGGVEGLAERQWPGACLQVGDVLIGVQDLRLRCIMTSFDPDTLAQDKSVTHGIYSRFQGKLALNCFVIQGGEIGVGDPVRVSRGRGCEGSNAGRS